MSDIKLVALDMDGTTYNWMGTIVDKNIKPIQDAMNAGVEVVFVTGRPALAPINELGELFTTPGRSVIAACNGSCIYDIKAKKIIESYPIDVEKAKKIFELGQREEFKDVVIFGWVDDLKTTITAHELDHKMVKMMQESFVEGPTILFNDVKDKFNYKVLKIMAANFKQNFIDELNKLDLELANSGFEVEINAKGINKAFAIQQLCKKDKITKEQVMAIGDGANDVPMIKYAKYGVSMSNSTQEVKDAASIHIDLDFKQGAVGVAIDKYVLDKK